MQNTTKKLALIAIGIVLTGTLAVTSVAMAATQQNPTTGNTNNGLQLGRGQNQDRPALTGFRYHILGQITAISATTVTVKDSAGTSFTIDAAKANIIINGTKSAIANLAVNDQVMVNGHAADSTTTQITAGLIQKGTAKVDLSTLKDLKDKEGKGRGKGMGMGRGMGKGPGMNSFEPPELNETTQQ